MMPQVRFLLRSPAWREEPKYPFYFIWLKEMSLREVFAASGINKSSQSFRELAWQGLERGEKGPKNCNAKVGKTDKQEFNNVVVLGERGNANYLQFIIWILFYFFLFWIFFLFFFHYYYFFEEVNLYGTYTVLFVYRISLKLACKRYSNLEWIKESKQLIFTLSR